MISLQKYIIESVYLIPLYNTYNDMMKFRPSSYLSTNGSKSSSPFLHTVGLFCLIFQFCLMYRLICKKPAHILSAQMALVSTFFQMFIVLEMYNFDFPINFNVGSNDDNMVVSKWIRSKALIFWKILAGFDVKIVFCTVSMRIVTHWVFASLFHNCGGKLRHFSHPARPIAVHKTLSNEA